jgi:hypothetical protein
MKPFAQLLAQLCVLTGAATSLSLALAQAPSPTPATTPTRAPTQKAASGVTEAQAKHLLAQMDQAIAARNVDGVTRWIADDVRISGALEASGQSTPFAYNKDEYAKALFDVWGAASQYSYKREDQVIRIQGQSALVTAQVIEQTQIGRQRIRTVTQERATIELRQGQPRITRLEAQGKVLP